MDQLVWKPIWTQRGNAYVERTYVARFGNGYLVRYSSSIADGGDCVSMVYVPDAESCLSAVDY